ncbi:membrane protein [Streptomyces hygroscopicus]|uniref:DUF202 domain-containing protein n=1 Tax=Streptomyces hygroscopicus TaxID=1912 RepID=UPI002240C13C|nr:DUF202 domain-containing protein [Streptomyces hygroscopicus]MCW7943047.1 membrane protein [Streptomyces hygroscopicus]
MNGPPPPRDPGLQPERTRLAWRRTTLSNTVAAVLAVKTALHTRTAAGFAVVAMCALLWLAFLTLAHRRIRALATADAGGSPRLTPRHAAAATLCTAALAVCAAALLF